MRARTRCPGSVGAGASTAWSEPRPASVTQAAGHSMPGRAATVVGRAIHEPSGFSWATVNGIVLLLSKQSSFCFPGIGWTALEASPDGRLVSVNLGTTSTLIVIEALEVRPMEGVPATEAAGMPIVLAAQSAASTNRRERSNRRCTNPLRPIHHSS